MAKSKTRAGRRTSSGTQTTTARAGARRLQAGKRAEQAVSDPWNRLSDRTQHAVCLLVLIAASIGFFAPIHFSEKSLVGGDTIQWRSMAEFSIEYREATGEEPLWAPNAFGGMPAYMISYPRVVPQLDTVTQWMRRILWPSSHLILLFVGTYLLVVFLTGNKLAGVLGGIAFGLTSYIPEILIAGHNSKFESLAFIPWVVLAFAYVLRKPRLLSALLFAIALALNLRAGHIQPTYYMAFLLGIWWLTDGISAARAKEWAPFARATGFLALGAVLAVLMVAQPYLAHAEYRDFTIRGAASGGEPGGLAWDYAMGWSQGPAELLTLLIANALGGGSPTYWGPKLFTEGPHYVGGIVLLLAGLGVWLVRSAVVRAFAIGAVLMLLFSLGEYFPLLNRPMFEYFPLFNALRVPETWLSVAAFALAVLGAFGAWHLAGSEPTPEEEAAKGRRTMIGLGVAVGFVLLLLIFRGVLFDFERDGEYQQIQQQVLAQQPEVSADDPRVRSFVQQYLSELEETRADLFADDALRTLVFLALAGGLIVLYRRRVLPASVLLGGLALLVLIDLWGVGRRYLTEDRLSDRSNAEAHIQEFDFDRYLLEQRGEAGGPGHFRVISFETGNPMTAARPSYFHESLGGYHGAKLRVYQDFIDHLLFAGPYGISDRALDMMNTRYLVAPNAVPGYEPVYRSEQTGMVVLENSDVLPRAFFVGETEVIENAEATWDRIHAPDFDPARVALLAESIDFDPVPIDSGDTAEARLLSYSPREIVWELETDAPRLLVVSEVYYPAGWHARLNGEEVPILRANYLLRAVPVPAGRHEFVMRFDPAGHRIGTRVAGASTAVVYGAVLILLVLPLVRRRRRGLSKGSET